MTVTTEGLNLEKEVKDILDTLGARILRQLRYNPSNVKPGDLLRVEKALHDAVAGLGNITGPVVSQPRGGS